MKDRLAITESNEEIDPGYFLIRLRLGEPVEVLPGQFAMVRPHGVEEPILRRALAVFRARGASVEFVYQVLGRGTQALSRVRPGDRADVLLPLGNTFPLEPVLSGGRRPLIVMGGIGSAGLLTLAEALIAEGSEPKIFFGGRTAGDLPGHRDFDSLGCPVVYATDDGSRGERAFVTAPLERELESEPPRDGWVIYSCGPWPMMARVAAIARDHRVPSYASVEARMACGFGICVACVVETREGAFKGPFRFQKVCTEGPIFDSEALAW